MHTLTGHLPRKRQLIRFCAALSVLMCMSGPVRGDVPARLDGRWLIVKIDAAQKLPPILAQLQLPIPITAVDGVIGGYMCLGRFCSMSTQEQKEMVENSSASIRGKFSLREPNGSLVDIDLDWQGTKFLGIGRFKDGSLTIRMSTQVRPRSFDQERQAGLIDLKCIQLGASTTEIDGRWQLVKRKRDTNDERQRRTDARNSGSKVMFHRGELHVGQDVFIHFMVPYTLQPDRIPAEIDIVGYLDHDPLVGSLKKGIYQRKGNGLLICWSRGERPGDFSVDGHPDRVLEEYKNIGTVDDDDAQEMANTTWKVTRTVNAPRLFRGNYLRIGELQLYKNTLHASLLYFRDVEENDYTKPFAGMEAIRLSSSQDPNRVTCILNAPGKGLERLKLSGVYSLRDGKLTLAVGASNNPATSLQIGRRDPYWLIEFHQVKK